MSATMDPPSPSASSILPGTTPSVGELSADLAREKRPKSPPLAFEKTSNDALAPLTSTGGSAIPSPSTMGRMSGLESASGVDLQVVVDQQAAALQLLHDAFAAERQAWSLEKERLYHRIASLEKLLKTGDGYSPAKSPVLSPLKPGSLTSPQSKSSATRLPSIAEDEPLPPPLSQRRLNAPTSILIPDSNHHPSGSLVSFDNGTLSGVRVDEIPISPSEDLILSPPPFVNRMEAGHTPIRTTRPLTPPPLNSLAVDGIDDTPTKNNTQLNTFITRSNDEEDDKELSGPLHMPELPNQPDAANFTFEALSKRLEQMEKDPSASRPMVFAERSPGLASPTKETAEGAENEKPSEDLPAPSNPAPVHDSASPEGSSNAVSSTVLSPLTKHASRDQDDDDKVQADFESGGIKLKTKLSTNFGAPLGQLRGFGAARKPSQDWQ